MKNENSPAPPFTIAELGQKFGGQLGAVYAELITLEKLIESQRSQIQEMTKIEARLTESAQDLEEDISLFKLENVELKEIIAELEFEIAEMKRIVGGAELAEIKTAAKPLFSPEAAEIAAKAIVDGKEKAAPD